MIAEYEKRVAVFGDTLFDCLSARLFRQGGPADKLLTRPDTPELRQFLAFYTL